MNPTISVCRRDAKSTLAALSRPAFEARLRRRRRKPIETVRRRRSERRRRPPGRRRPEGGERMNKIADDSEIVDVLRGAR
jgi:hypothetical protein